jgi:hypothetical protein
MTYFTNDDLAMLEQRSKRNIQELKELKNEINRDCLCGRKIPTFKQTLSIIAKFLQNPKTPQKLIDQALNDLDTIGEYLDKQQKGKNDN